MEQYEETTRTISRKRATKVEIPFLKIVRIPVRTQLEADTYLKKVWPFLRRPSLQKCLEQQLDTTSR